MQIWLTTLMLSLSSIFGLVNVLRLSVKDFPLALGLSNFTLQTAPLSLSSSPILSHRRQHCQDIACALTNGSEP